MRLNKFDLNLLIVLDALLDEGSVSRAAQHLNMTQPAVSNALNRLREHFQDDLLVRAGYGMTPTPLAESLRAPVQAALADIQPIVSRSTFDPQTTNRRFNIAGVDYLAQVFLAAVTRRVMSEAPDASVSIATFATNLEEEMRRGRLDLAVVSENLVNPSQSKRLLYTETFSCIAWQGNSDIGDGISMEQFLDMRHVVVRYAGAATFPTVDRTALASLDISPSIAIEVPSFALVPEHIVGTPYIATLPTSFAQAIAKRLPIKVLAPPMPLPAVSEYLIWSRHRETDKSVLWFIEKVQETAESFTGAAVAP